MKIAVYIHLTVIVLGSPRCVVTGQSLMDPPLVRSTKLNLQEPHLDIEALSARPAGVNPPASGYIDCPCLKRQTSDNVSKSSENTTQTSEIKTRVCERV